MNTTMIDLTDGFDVVDAIERDPTDKTVWAWKGKSLRRIPDWGTVVIGADLVLPEFRSEVEALIAGSSFVFTAPEGWAWAHLASALGAFPSVSRARKNGHNGPIASGITFKQFKIRKAHGELMVLNLVGTSWVNRK